MEFLSETQRVLILKISDNYILCLVCPIDGGARPALLRKIFNNKVKKEIISAMTKLGIL
jgi:hypothetical protein